MAGLVLVTPPAEEPLDLADAKAHLRIFHDLEDVLVHDLIVAARQHVEDQYGLVLIAQTFDYVLDRFPRGDTLLLPRAPVSAIGSVTYTPQGGTPQVWNAANYLLDSTSRPPRLVRAVDATWPTDSLIAAGGLVVRFTAGYASAAAVPEGVRHGLRLLVGSLYEFRESLSGVPLHSTGVLERLLGTHRWRHFA